MPSPACHFNAPPLTMQNSVLTPANVEIVGFPQQKNPKKPTTGDRRSSFKAKRFTRWNSICNVFGCHGFALSCFVVGAAMLHLVIMLAYASTPNSPLMYIGRPYVWSPSHALSFALLAVWMYLRWKTIALTASKCTGRHNIHSKKPVQNHYP